jgi:hypothetical protein
MLFFNTSLLLLVGLPRSLVPASASVGKGPVALW